VRSFNIQLDNLCQFLPQDRVVEFAKLSTQNLLLETETAISSELHEAHITLVSLKKEFLEKGSSIEERKKIRDDLKKKNLGLEAEVNKFKEREKHLELVQILERKKPYVIYNEEKKRYKE